MEGLASFAAWWGWCLVLGLLAAPAAAWLMPAAGDRGYLAGKALALVLGPFAAWWLASLGLASFSGAGPALALGAVALAGLGALAAGHRPSWRGVAAGEALFLPLLVVGTGIRAAGPEIEGLEKFMDFAFMNAAMRADAMPPEDPWMAGLPVNYYYFGHAMAGLWALIAHVPTDHGYNLAMGTLFALTGVLSFRLVADALPAPRMGAAMGALAALLVTLAGNFHVVVFGLFRPWAGSEVGRDHFYYPDSTRFIGYDPPTGDKAFTEFPAYGFAVGDMHGHVLALPVVLLGVMLLAAMLRGAPRFRLAQAGAFGLLWGVSYMTNSWDLAILGLLALLTALAMAARGGWSRRALDRIGAGALLILTGAVLAAGPFQQGFEPFVQGVRLTENRTPVWQILAVYGHLLVPALLLAAAPLRPAWRSGEVLAGALLAWGLLLMIAIPEIVYVKDFYGEDFARANTMFKLAFRSQMFGALAACIALGWLALRPGRAGLAAAAVLSVPLAATLTYPGWALEGRFTPERISGWSLDGLGHMDRQDPSDRALADMIARLPYAPGEIMLEAEGQSYTYEGRLASATGVPTILGWFNHEWFWRGDLDAVARRAGEVRAIYEGTDDSLRCELLARYRVRYVVIGGVERRRYPAMDAAHLSRLGPVLFEHGTSRLVQVGPGGLCAAPQ